VPDSINHNQAEDMPPRDKSAAELRLRAVDILERVAEAFIALDSQWRIVYANHEACRINQKPLEAFRGKVHWEEWPASLGTALEHNFRRVMSERAEAHFDHRYVSKPYDVWLEIDVYPATDGIDIFYRDVSERRHMEETLRESERSFRQMADAIPHIAWTTGPDGSVDYYNQRWYDYSGLTLAQTQDWGWVAAIHPDDLERADGVWRAALAAGTISEVEYRLQRADGRYRWHLGRSVPVWENGRIARWVGTATDIEDHFLAESALTAAYRREAILNQIAQAVLHASDARDIQVRTVTALGRALDADRCYVHFFDASQDATWIETDWHREGLPSVAGRYPLSQVQPLLLDDLFQHGASVRISSVRESFLQPETVSLLEQGGYHALLTTPFYSHDRLTAVLALAMADTARAWTDDEVNLVEAVAAQTRSAVEAARLLAERQAHLKQEALVGRIGVALRATLDPEAVLEVAVRELGQALEADRCYYAAYDQEADLATAGPDWRLPGLPTIAGTYSMSQFAINRAPEYKAGRTQVLADTSGDPAAQALGLRALVRVPLVSGAAMTSLSVAMAHGPRAWTADDVALVETVATQTQSALEAVRVRRREHAIAEQLAQALQPDTPPSVPGMKLAEYYRPALEDQGVGGDFSDVFSNDKGVTFLVVGDLSGKGLAAASQVAMVRHMLRFALYNGRTVVGPVASLNKTLADHELLTGFSTLFVGRYDAGASTLTYVNCGQDAGIVLRGASGAIESLPPTGPVLGAISMAVYTEETVSLERGDVLALYTDGLTEAGPSRTVLLTGEGVANLLRGQAGLTDPGAIVERIMAGVDAYAGQGVRDDQCVLVGVVTGSRAF